MNKKPYFVMEDILQCPVCSSTLKKNQEYMHCENKKCNKQFPIINGIPVLINESSSIFSHNDFIQDKNTTFQDISAKRAKIGKILPKNSKNLMARENYQEFLELIKDQVYSDYNPKKKPMETDESTSPSQRLFERDKSRSTSQMIENDESNFHSQKPKILVIGGSILGEGIETIINNPSIDIIEGDVSMGPRTQIIFDAHDLPFNDSSFQGVIIQAVLEHVLDPKRCVEEIYRVLDDQGLVYAETPFMQPVHMGAYDFNRFTPLGHRRLFRQFQEIKSGATGGPGMSLAWSYQYFLLSFAQKRFTQDVMRGFARLTSFWWKYFDRYLINKPGGLDAAFGIFFLGKKSSEVLPDKELIKSYAGAQ
jgi:uncharacterized protein YbaR (Trm112 family)